MLKEREILSELAQKYDFHPQQITTWKAYFWAHEKKIFKKEDGTNKEQNSGKDRGELFRTIGQQKVEIDYFKKIALNQLNERCSPSFVMIFD